MIRRIAIALVVALVVFAGRPRPVQACSCANNGVPFLYLGADNKLPAGDHSVFWYGIRMSPVDEGRVRVEKLDRNGSWVQDEFRAVEHGHSLLEIIPASWGANSRFRISIRQFEFMRLYDNPRQKPKRRPPRPYVVIQEFSWSRTTLDGSAAIELHAEPAEVGLTSGPGGAGCRREFNAAAVAVQPSLPASLEPFRDYLLYETHVDGELWLPQLHNCDQFPGGRNRFTRGGKPYGYDVVYSECLDGEGPYRVSEPKFIDPEGRERGGVAPGTHFVQVVASSPDGGFRIASNRVTVNLNCESDLPPETEPAPELATGQDRAVSTDEDVAARYEDRMTSNASSDDEAPPAHTAGSHGRCSVRAQAPGDRATALWMLALISLGHRRLRGR